MKTEKNIFIAFLLNLLFSILEFFGGVFTGSVAIISDAVHDFGDAASIGLSYFLEKTSKKQPNEVYTYGYARFSVLGGVITSFMLTVGSIALIYNAVHRLLRPVAVNYDGMLLLAIVGLIVNSLATYFTHGGHSIHQKAVNLHMLEDVLGWLAVLIGAIVMRFTNFYLLDPILSIAIAIFVLFGSFLSFKEITDIFLMKKPKHIDVARLKSHILEIAGVHDIHHLHIWTIDGERVYATLHIVAVQYSAEIKSAVKRELHEQGITHTTIEMETAEEECFVRECMIQPHPRHAHHHHCHC